MEKLSKKITGWCRRYYPLQEEWSIIEYGIQLFLNTTLKIAGIMLTGIVIGHFREMVVAIFVFGSIRNFAGGRHCQSDFGCFASMLCICLCPILMFPIELHIAKYIWGMIAVYSLYQVIQYAPRNSTINPIVDMRILKKKRVGSLIVVGMYLLFLRFYPGVQLRWLVAIPLFAEALTISQLFYKKG